MTWQQIRRFLWEWRGVSVAAPTLTILILGLRFTGIMQPWEWEAYDVCMQLRYHVYKEWKPSENMDDRIVIVGIDEDDLRELGQAIIPDQVYAEVIEKIKAMKPRAIGLDIYRDQPVEPGNAALVKIFENTPRLVGIQKVVGDSSRETVAPPPVLKAKGQVGSNDLIYDRDRVVRRGLLSLSDGEGHTIPSFAFYVAMLYLDAEGIKIRDVPGTTHWQVGDRIFLPFESYDGSYINVDANGYQLLLDYRVREYQFNHVSLMDVRNGRVSPEWGRDKIVLIGAISEGSQDLFFTPFTRTPSERMPGVEVHANIASMVLSHVLDDRPLIQTWSEPLEGVWVAIWGFIGAFLTWKRHRGSSVRSFSTRKGLEILAGMGALLGGSFVFFLASWWVPVIPAFLAFTGSAIGVTAYIARSAGEIRQTFGRYLSEEIVATLLEDPEGLAMGGDRQILTILTSDIRGFTALSERLPPEEVVRILNFYLEYMADTITRYMGTIDEFMGDGILVLFGAPIQREDDAKRAVACALAMQLAMDPVNRQMKAWGLPDLDMGIGIHTGEVVVGNIGSLKRTKYGVVGSTVNLTYRIESYTTGGQILISESTLALIGRENLRIDSQMQVQPKGASEPITVYGIGGIGDRYQIYLPEPTEDIFLEMLTPMTLTYTILEGKHVGENQFEGRMIKLSEKGAEICADRSVEKGMPIALSNIKINFDNMGANLDVYAKVLDRVASPTSFYVYFTAKPPEVTLLLNTLLQTLQVEPSQESQSVVG